MKNRKAFLIIGIVLGVLAAGSTYVYTASYTKTKTVYTLKQDVEAGTPITADMIQAKELPLSAVPADAITDPNAIYGKSVKGLTLEDTVIRLGHLVNTRDARLSGLLKEKGDEYRALALPVTIDSTVGGQIQAGDRVDIYALEKTGAIIMGEGIEVLVGTPVKTKNSNNNDPKESSIILAVPHEKVKPIMDALARGAKMICTLQPLQYEVGPENANTVEYGG